MFLRAFKENSNKKILNKLLSERYVNVDNSEIESLGVIFNLEEINAFDLFKTLSEKIKINPNNVKIIAFSKEKKNDLNTWDVSYNPNDFGWNGEIKNTELQSFLDKKFDVLISYYLAENSELKLITAKSKAKFKIGNLQTDSRLNDLIIKTNLNEFDVFENEVFKYLTILNKIKK
jgi:hypothetical protein